MQEAQLGLFLKQVNGLIGELAHDLRGSLNVAAGYADLLAAESSGPLNAKQKQFAERIQTETRALDHKLQHHRDHIENTLPELARALWGSSRP